MTMTAGSRFGDGVMGEAGVFFAGSGANCVSVDSVSNSTSAGVSVGFAAPRGARWIIVG